MKIKIEKDKEKAKSLIETADITLERLKELNKNKYPSNALTDYYEIIHKYLEALAGLEGIKIKGEGSHQELIDYICKSLNFNESTRIFLQDIRDYRNRINYEGFSVNKEFIENNYKRIEEIISKLKDIYKKRL